MCRFIFLMGLMLSTTVSAEDLYQYHSMSIPYGDSWNIVRYQNETGRAWYVDNNYFIEIKDENRPPIGHYEFQAYATHKLVFSFPPVISYWQLVRINTKTGDTWWAKEDQWIKVKNVIPHSL